MKDVELLHDFSFVFQLLLADDRVEVRDACVKGFLYGLLQVVLPFGLALLEFFQLIVDRVDRRNPETFPLFDLEGFPHLHLGFIYAIRDSINPVKFIHGRQVPEVD